MPIPNPEINPNSCEYSACAKRNKIYQNLLSEYSTIYLPLLIKTGTKLMKKAKLHPHYFADNSLQANAEYLACHILGLNYPGANLQIDISPTQAKNIISLFEQRIDEHLPVEYITQEANYLGNSFYVNKDVLVPRSIMSYRFVDFLSMVNWQNYRVLDLCCGSGCIGITLALMADNLKVDLLDISPKALDVAKKNIEKFDLQTRVNTIESDLFASDKLLTYDLIITNPPYVTEQEYLNSPLEFKAEPRLALVAANHGMSITTKIIEEAKQYLNPNGLLVAEIGFTVAKLIKKQYKQLNFTWYKYRDATGKESWFGMDGCFSIPANYLN